MDRLDLESGRGVLGDLAGLHQLLRDAHGGPPVRHGAGEVSWADQEERPTLRVDQQDPLRRESARHPEGLHRLKNESLSPVQERKYKKLRKELIAEVKSLRLNQARIDALVEQLYDINKRLVSYEGRLMRR